MLWQKRPQESQLQKEGLHPEDQWYFNKLETQSQALQSVNETEDDDSRQVEYRIYLDEDREYSLTRLVGYLSRPDATTAIQP